MVTVLLFFVTLAHSTWAAPKLNENPSATFDHRYTIGQDTFLIRAKRTFVTISYAAGEGEKVEYSVYRNGKFVHPCDPNEGGTLVGCRTDRSSPKSRSPIRPFSVNASPAGWLVESGKSCGSRSTDQYHVIWMNSRSLSSPFGCYQTTAVDSNAIGVLVRAPSEDTKTEKGPKSIEIWHHEYGPDCGAGTLSYPKRTVLSSDFSVRRTLPKDPKDWPKNSDFPPYQFDQQSESRNASIYPASYAESFIVGWLHRDVPLLNRSLSLFPGPQPKEPSETFCNPIPEFVPRSAKSLKQVVSAVEVLNQAGL
jgi:hypothetical protein